MRAMHRREMIRRLGALAASAMGSSAPRAADDHTHVSPEIACTATSGGRLFVPGIDGFLGRLTPGDDVLTLEAVDLSPALSRQVRGLTAGYLATHRGHRYLNPTLVLHKGQRLRVAFIDRIAEPTIVHWHGLAVDTNNDGNGTFVTAPGGRYDYDFEVRNRASLYWYHPHPHGLTAGQAYRGLFGMIEVDDTDEQRLRRELDLVPGRSEITLVLQDRRGPSYSPTETDRVHGWLGDTVQVNGSTCPHLDVSTRIHRLRILNASNARTYLLGLRTPDGKALPFS